MVGCSHRLHITLNLFRKIGANIKTHCKYFVFMNLYRCECWCTIINGEWKLFEITYGKKSINLLTN